MINIVLKQHKQFLLEAMDKNRDTFVRYEWFDSYIIVNTYFSVNRRKKRTFRIDIIVEDGFDNNKVFYDFNITSLTKSLNITDLYYTVNNINEVFTTLTTLLNRHYKEELI